MIRLFGNGRKKNDDDKASAAPGGSCCSKELAGMLARLSENADKNPPLAPFFEAAEKDRKGIGINPYGPVHSFGQRMDMRIREWEMRRRRDDDDALRRGQGRKPPPNKP